MGITELINALDHASDKAYVIHDKENKRNELRSIVLDIKLALAIAEKMEYELYKREG